MTRLLALLLASVAACGAPRSRPSTSSAPHQSAPPSSFREGEAVIEGSGLRGAFVWRDADGSRTRVAFPALAGTRLSPASTFKIANTLIALETGVAPDERFRLPWDGVKRRLDSWNRDHDLRSALDASVVWYYQELARRIGAKRMREWLGRLGYGNEEMGDKVDEFWLAGPLAISALEQVDFTVQRVRWELAAELVRAVD